MFDIFTLILLAQTLFDFVTVIFDRYKKKTENSIRYYELILFACMLCAYFLLFDYGFGILIKFLVTEGFQDIWAKVIAITGYYLGYNLAKKHFSSEFQSTKINAFAGSIVYTPAAVCGTLAAVLLSILIKNKILGY